MCYLSWATKWAGIIWRQYMISLLQVRNTTTTKINKPSCDHYVFHTLRRLHPFSRTLGIYLEHDLSHISHLSVAWCAFIPQQIVSTTSKISILIIKYWKWCANQCEQNPNIKWSEDQIHTATGRNLFQHNGMINIHRLIKSSKGYTFKTICWTEFQPHSNSVVKVDILSAVKVQFIISS